MDYTIDFFLKKFKAIPWQMWVECDSTHCAYFFCGASDLKEEQPQQAKALSEIFKKFGTKHPVNFYGGLDWNVVTIHDGFHPDFQQATPKERIIAALQYLKAKELAKGVREQKLIRA